MTDIQCTKNIASIVNVCSRFNRVDRIQHMISLKISREIERKNHFKSVLCVQRILNNTQVWHIGSVSRNIFLLSRYFWQPKPLAWSRQDSNIIISSSVSWTAVVIAAGIKCLTDTLHRFSVGCLLQFMVLGESDFTSRQQKPVDSFSTLSNHFRGFICSIFGQYAPRCKFSPKLVQNWSLDVFSQ